MQSTWNQLGSLMMWMGILLGTLGTNMLKLKASKEALYYYKNGILYHLIHSSALFLISYLSKTYSDPHIQYAGLSFLTGILLYSGALYLFTITEIVWLRIIEHIGILFFLLGWFLLLHSNYQVLY